MGQLTTLREVLLQEEDSPWDTRLFLPPDEVWNLETRSAILAVPGEHGHEEEPPFAREHGLCYALGMNEVKDIVINAREQVAGATADQLMAALLFYYDRDAFIDFASE